MTRVDFYILDENGSDNRLETLCRLTRKIYGLGHKLVIFAPDTSIASEVDERLWTYQPDSFIPHEMVDSTGQISDTPVLICTDIREMAGDVLINLGIEMPGCGDRFSRIVEIIGQDERQSGRERYRQYQSHNMQIQTHQLGDR